MNRWALCSIAIFLFAVSTTMAASAQSSPPAPVAGQNSAYSAVQNPPKKVWTNEDISTLGTHPANSTSQPTNTAPSKSGGKTDRVSKGRDAKWYQDQIAKLEAKIPPLDDQISKLQTAIEGKPTGDAKSSTRPHGVRQGDWPTELAELQKLHEGILNKISALQDEARHKGIPPNVLP